LQIDYFVLKNRRGTPAIRARQPSVRRQMSGPATGSGHAQIFRLCKRTKKRFHRWIVGWSAPSYCSKMETVWVSVNRCFFIWLFEISSFESNSKLS